MTHDALIAAIVAAAVKLAGARGPEDLTAAQADRLFKAMCGASVTLLHERTAKRAAMPPERTRLTLVACDGEPTLEGEQILDRRRRASAARAKRKAANS